MTAPLLIEIGVEEIPAGTAYDMADQLETALFRLLYDHDIRLDEAYEGLGATPRRLLFHAESCPVMQADRKEVIWGPPEKVAFDADGNPTKAAEGFAKKSGLSVSDFSLEEKGDGKGHYMKAVIDKKGRKVADIIAEALPDILRKLNSPKQMQWQDGESRNDSFIRPVRWIVARLGDEVVPFSFAGIEAGKTSYAHRMCTNAKGEISVDDPFGWLSDRMVTANRNARRKAIADGLKHAAKEAGVNLVEDSKLVEEVTDLTEWPHVITGHYLEDFLRLPIEVSRIELKHHQRCFSTHDGNGKTSNVFFAVANIKSKDPAAVAHGNERVVNARLADAAFFFDRDPQETLEARVEKLSEIVFQDGLGMVGDQVRRLRGFVLDNADKLGVDANEAQRAAYLCKSDLTTGLVGEFPELQGYMGGIYAEIDGESSEVSQAIAEHYAPAGADDALPESALARAIGIAERIDKLLGYFHLGKIPTASADPFALRRAAIGLVRLLINTTHPVTMTLNQVIAEGAKQWNQQRVTIAISDETKQQVHDFIYERLLGMSGSLHFSRTAIDAAVNSSEVRPLYQEGLIAGYLMGFEQSLEGKAIAAANKRIANILKKAKTIPSEIDAALFTETAEKALYDNLIETEADFYKEISKDKFESSISPALTILAGLREPVDSFFDDVMVMADDVAVRNNRLALLSRLRNLFLNLADVSRL